MTKIIKTLGIDIPKGKEVISTIEDGEIILFDDISYMKLPKGQWKILSIENNVIHLLPKSKEIAVNDGWITKD